MTKLQWRALAVACWLGTVACVIAFLGIRDEYTMYRDGPRVVGKVVPSDRPGSKHHRVHFVDTSQLGRSEARDAYVPAADALPLGASIDLALHRINGGAIAAADVSDKAPPLWLIPLAIVALVLGVYVWTIPNRSARRRARRTSPRDVLVDAAGRTRNQMIALGVFCLLAGGAFVAVPSLDDTATRGEGIAIYVLAALTLATAGVLLRRGYQLRDPSNNPILTLIEKQPHDIAWFYVARIKAKAGQEALAVRIWKTDGKQVVLNGVEEDLTPLMAEIARCAPHAKAGYDAETERLYKQDPRRWG